MALLYHQYVFSAYAAYACENKRPRAQPRSAVMQSRLAFHHDVAEDDDGVE